MVLRFSIALLNKQLGELDELEGEVKKGKKSPDVANKAFERFSFYDLSVFNPDKTEMKKIPEMKVMFNKLCDYVSVMNIFK